MTEAIPVTTDNDHRVNEEVLLKETTFQFRTIFQRLEDQ